MWLQRNKNTAVVAIIGLPIHQLCGRSLFHGVFFPVYHGLPCLHQSIAWHTMFAGDLHTRTGRTMVHHGIPCLWFTMVYHAASMVNTCCFTMAYHGEVHHGTLCFWFTAANGIVVYHGVPCYTVVYRGKPWYTRRRIKTLEALMHPEKWGPYPNFEIPSKSMFCCWP